MAAVQNLTDYVAILADASDAPDATTAKEIDDLAKGILAVGESAGTLKHALTKGNDTEIGELFGASGPVSSFAGHLSELAGVIEVIADQAHDVKTLQKAILGLDGQRVSALLGDLARDTDQLSCIRFQARLGAMDTDAQRLSAQLFGMSRDQRLSVVRTYPQNQSAVPDTQCGALASATAVSPIAQMLAALQKAHKDLERIARGDLTRAERRREVAITMQRLGAVFKSISAMALLVI